MDGDHAVILQTGDFHGIGGSNRFEVFMEGPIGGGFGMAAFLYRSDTIAEWILKQNAMS